MTSIPTEKETPKSASAPVFDTWVWADTMVRFAGADVGTDKLP